MKTHIFPRLIAVFFLLVGLRADFVMADNDFIVYSPQVVQGQSEVEMYGFNTQDSRAGLGGAQGYNFSIAHAFTDWWKPELYIAQFNRDPGGPLYASGYEFENTFQLTPVGEYWADLGLLASYAYNKQPGAVNGTEFGPLLEKWSGHINQRLNLIWGKQIGGGASNNLAFRAAYSASYKFDIEQGSIAPGLEFYYRPNDNAYQVGPVVYGETRTGRGNEIEYSLGLVSGINPTAPANTWLFRIEYEFFAAR